MRWNRRRIAYSCIRNTFDTITLIILRPFAFTSVACEWNGKYVPLLWATLALRKTISFNASAPNFNDAKCELNECIQCTLFNGVLVCYRTFNRLLATAIMKQKCCVHLSLFECPKNCNTTWNVTQWRTQPKCVIKVKKRGREIERQKKRQRNLRAPENWEPECVKKNTQKTKSYKFYIFFLRLHYFGVDSENYRHCYLIRG